MRLLLQPEIHDGYNALPNIRNHQVFTQEELDSVIADHTIWQNSNGAAGERAYFAHCELAGLNFRGVNLNGAMFEYTDLTGSDFREASVISCSFRSAILKDCDLAGADFSRSNLLGTDLTNVNLYDTKFALGMGNGVEIKTVNICKYTAAYTTEWLQFNCELHPISWWRTATKADLIVMEPSYLTDNIDMIFDLLHLHLAVIDAAPAKAARMVNTLGS